MAILRRGWLILAVTLIGCSDDGDSTGSGEGEGSGDGSTTGTSGDSTTGGISDDLDCEWFASDDNCWRPLLLDAGACVPGNLVQGALAADDSSCTHPGGSVVDFVEPMSFPNVADIWDFTVTTDDIECLHFIDSSVDPEGVFELTTAGGTFRETLGPEGLVITCPDGSRHSGHPQTLFACANLEDDFPGISTSTGEGFASFELLNGAGGDVPVFDCVR